MPDAAGAHEDPSSGSKPLRQSSRNRVPSRRAEEMMRSEAVSEEKAVAKTSKKSQASQDKKEVSVHNSANVEEEDEEEDNDDDDNNEDDDDDDDDEEYCICRKGDTGTPMVFCGECEGWFHFKCVGLTKKAAESVLEFVCPPCNEKTGRTSKIEGKDAKEVDEGNTSPAFKRKRSEEGERSKRARRSLSPIETSVERTPSAASPTTSTAPKDKPPPRKASTSSFTAPSSSKSHSSSAVNVLRSRSEALRNHAREQFVAIFGEIMNEADVADEQSRSFGFTHDFEKALFAATGEAMPKANFRVAGKAYRDKLRSFLFNLKDKSNAALRSRIADGTLSAQELSMLTSEELANDSMREELERRRRENLEQSILKKEAAPLRKLTHKGEIDIEYENAQQREAVVDASEHTPRSENAIVTKTEDAKEHEGDRVAYGNQSTPPAARRISQPVQSPTLPFDFTNVWQGSPQMDSSENGDEANEDDGTAEAEINVEDAEDAREGDDVDNFIDNFLGMPDGEAQPIIDQDATKQNDDIPSAPSHSWQGSINMPDEGVFSCAVRQIAGRSLGKEEWDNLFPTQHTLIEGRLPSGSAVPYLLQSRVAIRTEVVALAAEVSWLPELMQSTFNVDSDSANKTTFERMVQYFQKKDRYGVLQPKKTARGKYVKDFYIAALPKGQPLPEWLTILDSLQFTEQDRKADMFVLVAVLFKSQSVPPVAAVAGHAGPSKSPLNLGATPPNPGSTPPANIASMLGPGSTTLQDLLRAVGGGSRNPPGASPVPPAYSGVGMQSPNYDGATPPLPQSLASTAYSPGQAVPASSVQALSQLPKTQLEDVLTKNPTLVDDLLKTLNKTGSGVAPPGPPPMRPPALHHQTPIPHQSYPQVYPGRNNYGGSNNASNISQGYPSSDFSAQGFAPRPSHHHHHHQQQQQQQQNAHGGAGRNFGQHGRGGGNAQYPYRGGGRGGRGQW